MLDAIRADNTGPTLSTRNLAILHTAIYDAVNSVARTHQPYRVALEAPAQTSIPAAAAAAGRSVLRVLYPTFNARTETVFGEMVAGLVLDEGLTNGLALGDAVALDALSARASDGSSTQVPYIPSAEPGQWLRTPPFYRPPLDPHWRYVELFCPEDMEPYVAPGAPPLDSDEYARDWNEVRMIGGLDSPVRSAEQSEIAVFWSDFSYTAMPPGHWHEIAATIATDRGDTLITTARLLALMSLVQADAAIVCWEGKYRFNFWRPVTAIWRADEDGNPLTEADETWEALLPAPNFPEYPSGHSTFSKAGAQILTSFYGTDAITFTAWSDSLPGVTRTYESLAACADEVGLSRIYGGFHFQFANRDGKASGKHVADFVAANYLLPISSLPFLRLEGFVGTQPVLRVHGEVGREYELQASPDFSSWTAVTVVVGQPGGVSLQDSHPSPTGSRFYRLVALGSW